MKDELAIRDQGSSVHPSSFKIHPSSKTILHPYNPPPMSELKLFNTLTREKETFEPLVPGEVRMYSCGPTVYNHLHIGNMRTFLWGDLLRRYLEFRGFRVTQIMNITDVEDKIIRNANAAGKDIFSYT